MPYSRKRKSFKKRYGKKHRKNKKPHFSMPALYKALYPTRVFKYSSNGALDTQLNNLSRWSCVGVIGDAGHHELAMTTVGRENPSLDLTVTDLFTKTTTDHAIYLKTVAKFMLQNVSNHGANIEMYECVARQDIRYTTKAFGDTAKLVMNLLYLGWDKIAASADVDIAPSGTHISHTNGNDYIIDTTSQYRVWDASDFCQQFKIVASKKFALLPGQKVNLALKGKSYKHVTNLAGEDVKANDQDPELCYGGVTKFYLIKQTGFMGKATTDDSKVGYMTTDLAWDLNYTTRVMPTTQRAKTMAVSISNRTNPGVLALEGPTVFSMANQNQ